MKQYNALQAFYMSFYSRKLYRDVSRNWGGYAYFYLLFLLAVSWIPLTHSFQHDIDQAYDKLSESIVLQAPVLTIKDGVISTPENRPYFITEPKSKDIIAVIDTSGKYTTLAKAKTNLLITKTEIISETKPNEIRTNTLHNTINMTVDANIINQYIKEWVGYSWIVVFAVLVIGSYAYRLVQALLYSLIGKLMGVFFNAKTSYGHIMQIAMVAITPAILASTIFDYFNITFSYQNTFYFALTLIYLSFGILANKPPKNKGTT